MSDDGAGGPDADGYGLGGAAASAAGATVGGDPGAAGAAIGAASAIGGSPGLSTAPGFSGVGESFSNPDSMLGVAPPAPSPTIGPPVGEATPPGGYGEPPAAMAFPPQTAPPPAEEQPSFIPSAPVTPQLIGPPPFFQNTQFQPNPFLEPFMPGVPSLPFNVPLPPPAPPPNPPQMQITPPSMYRGFSNLTNPLLNLVDPGIVVSPPFQAGTTAKTGGPDIWTNDPIEIPAPPIAPPLEPSFQGT